MANSSEPEETLEVAIAGIPRIAKVIADYPIELREGALELVFRSHQRIPKSAKDPSLPVWARSSASRLP